jgi:glycosyltransferase involved in cell wall biosynthesis
MLTLLGSLDPERYRPVLACVDATGPLLPDALALGLQPFVLGRSRRWDPTGMLRLAGLVRDQRAVVVHGWLFMSSVYARFGGRLGRAPVVVAAEGHAKPVLGRRREPITRVIETALAPLTDGYVANSEATARGMQRLGVPRTRIEIIPNGVSPQPPMSDIARGCIREEIGVSTDAPLVAMVARLDAEYKDHGTFLRSLASLPGVFGAVVGDGPDRAATEALATSLGIRDRVAFTGFRADARRVAAAADVSVLLTRGEGLSNALLESMGAARPVITTDIAANREVVRHEIDGLLVSVGDVEATSAAILRLLSDSSEARRMGDAARERVVADFSPAAQAERTMAFYDRLLARKRH